MSEAAPAAEVVLNMPARAEGVGVVRQALAGMADALAFDAAVLSDMKMAVTEACTNVVVHAYDEESGELEVEMLAGEDERTRLARPAGRVSAYSIASIPPQDEPNRWIRSSSRASLTACTSPTKSSTSPRSKIPG